MHESPPAISWCANSVLCPSLMDGFLFSKKLTRGAEQSLEEKIVITNCCARGQCDNLTRSPGRVRGTRHLHRPSCRGGCKPLRSTPRAKTPPQPMTRLPPPHQDLMAERHAAFPPPSGEGGERQPRLSLRMVDLCLWRTDRGQARRLVCGGGLAGRPSRSDTPRQLLASEQDGLTLTAGRSTWPHLVGRAFLTLGDPVPRCCRED